MEALGECWALATANGDNLFDTERTIKIGDRLAFSLKMMELIEVYRMARILIDFWNQNGLSNYPSDLIKISDLQSAIQKLEAHT